jgi:hypothetical protein
MSKVKRGTAGEYIVKAKALLAGFNVYCEGNQDSKVDFILEKNHLLYRIQVKIINPQGNLPVRKLTHSKTNHTQSWYSKKEIDYLCGVDLATFDVYLFPLSLTEKFTGQISVSKHGNTYKNNFDLLEPYFGNIISGSPQVGEPSGDGDTELAGESRASVETLRETPKLINEHGEDKVQTTNFTLTSTQLEDPECQDC